MYVEDPDDDDDDALPITVHPHITPSTMTQMETIMLQYHRGRKYNVETGKTEFTKPDYLWQELPAAFEFATEIIKEVTAAETLIAACIAGCVRPRTVNDVKALRDEAAGERKRFHHLFQPASFKLLAPPGWKALHVHGPSGMGKTKWACAQFQNPLLIKPFNSIGCLEAIMRKYDPKFHDGMVLNEADLKNFMTREQVIAFVDCDEDCELDVRFKSFTVPAGVRKIFISNPPPQNLYPADSAGAIARRMMYMYIGWPTWQLQPPRAPAPQPQPQPVPGQPLARLSPGMPPQPNFSPATQ